MTTIRAYRKNDSGFLEIIDLVTDDQGHPCNGAGYPLIHTDRIVSLVGWPDSRCRVYETDAGVGVYVPEAPSASYTVEQTETGIILGEYTADSPEQAWALCCEDAGYSEPQQKQTGIAIRETAEVDHA